MTDRRARFERLAMPIVDVLYRQAMHRLSSISSQINLGLVRIVFDMLELFGERFLAFLLVLFLGLSFVGEHQVQAMAHAFRGLAGQRGHVLCSF